MPSNTSSVAGGEGTKGESREEGGVEEGEGRVGRKEEWREERREEGRKEEWREERREGGREERGRCEGAVKIINTW